MCALLTKPERREVDLPTRYIGFEIPDKFAIGYGLDYAERYRNLPVCRGVDLPMTIDRDHLRKASGTANRGPDPW